MLMAMHTGRKFDFQNLELDDFRIEDIAHALSNICRFGGHSPQFYSVAQHSTIACQLVRGMDCSELLQRTTLLHDASEAYLGDVIKHIKQRIPFYKDMEYKMMWALSNRFNFQWPLPEVVEAVDRDLLETEMLTFWDGRDLSWRPTYGVPMKLNIKPLLPAQAKHEFLEECLRLRIE